MAILPDDQTEPTNLLYESSYTQSSPFLVIENKTPPRLTSPSVPWFMGVPVVLILSALYVNFIGLGSSIRVLGLLAMISVLFGAILHSANLRRRKLDAMTELLSSLSLDLENLADALKRYLKKLDARASRVFNSLTPNEVAAQYFLSQMSTALNQRVVLVNDYLVDPTGESIAVAYELLQRPLIVNESVVVGKNKNTARPIPLKDLRSLASQLIDEIEKALSRIAEEMAGKTYPPVDEYPNSDEDVT